jgi:hypothetical protein
VLFGDFTALARAGFDDVLRGGTLEVLRTDGQDLFDLLVDAMPHVVVLDGDQTVTTALIGRLVREFPSVTVVACSTRDPLMRVYPPFHRGEFYEAYLEPEAFLVAVQG